MTEGKKTPGFHSQKLAEVPNNEINPGMIEMIRGVSGVDTNVVEEPGGKPKVVITRNSVVLPEEKKKTS